MQSCQHHNTGQPWLRASRHDSRLTLPASQQQQHHHAPVCVHSGAEAKKSKSPVIGMHVHQGHVISRCNTKLGGVG